MSQNPWEYAGAPYSRFDPNDPLVSTDFGGWWNRGVAVVRRGWRPLLLVQVVTGVPALALLVPGQVSVDLATERLMADATSGAEPAFGDLIAAGGISLVTAMLATVIYAIGGLVSVRLVVLTATGAEPRAGRAFREALSRVPALIGWSVLVGLISIVALLLCILPIFYVAAVFVVLPAVVLFERTNAVSRCFRLFNNDFAAAAGRVATIGGLAVAVALFFAGIGTAVTLVIGTATDGAIITGSVITSVLTGIGSMATGVLLAPLIVTTYADLRARHEPFRTADLPA